MGDYCAYLDQQLFCRELQNSNTVKCLVKQFGALKAVGALFIKYSERWQAGKENEKTLLDIIRVIHEYSRFRNYDSILEVPVSPVF